MMGFPARHDSYFRVDVVFLPSMVEEAAAGDIVLQALFAEWSRTRKHENP